MTGAFGRRQCCLLAAWVVPFLGWFLVVKWYPESQLCDQAVQRKALRVYSNPNFYREMEKPAEFGLEKIASVVNYLLLATAAILAFITKSIMDFRSERAKGEAGSACQPRRYQFLLFLHAGIACFFSLTYGVVAYLALPDISVVETFAVTGSLSRAVLGQIAGILFAVLLLLVALGGLVRDLLP